MQLLFLDTKPNNPNRYISRAVFKALERHPAVTRAVWADYADAIARAQATPFDALVAFDGEEGHNAVLSRLCGLIPRRAIWFTEDPYETQRNLATARLFDRVFTNDRASAAAYDGGAHHLPLGGDRESQFIPIAQEPPLYDLFFAGTAWPNRLAFLRALRQARPELRLKLVLVTNPALAPYIRGDVDGFAFSPGISIRDFCRVANRSLLTLALPRRFSTDPARPEAASDTPGPRLFEVALAGGAQLVDGGTTPQAAELFAPEREFLTYTAVEDCLAAVDRARRDPAAVRAIAAAAQERCLAEHTYDHRAARLVESLEALPAATVTPHPVELRGDDAPRRPNVLFIAHNIADYGHFGGAEIYLEQIRRNAARVDVSVLVPDRRPGARAHSYALFGPDGAVVDTLAITTPINTGDLVHPEFEHAFQRLLARHAFDVVHINHLKWFPFSLPHHAKAYGAKVFYSLHDYHAVCESFNLIGFENRYCDIPNRPPQTCDVCLGRMFNWGPGSQARRRRFLRESLTKVDVLLAGSKASASVFGALFPHLEDRITILPPPLPKLPARRPEPVRDHAAEGEAALLDIALLGNFTRVKGAATALAVFEASRHLPVRFHIFGRIDQEFAGAVADERNAHSVIVHGPYEPGTIPEAAGTCDLALVLSPWPETYCISLSEVQALGLVPIVTALGAQAERVEDGQNGFAVPIDDPRAVVAILSELVRAPGRLKEMAARLPTNVGWGGADFTAALEDLYLTVTAATRPLGQTPDVARVFDLDELDVALNAPRWLTSGNERPPSIGWTTRQVARARRSRDLLQRFVDLSRSHGLQTAFTRGLHWFSHWRDRQLRRLR